MVLITIFTSLQRLWHPGHPNGVVDRLPGAPLHLHPRADEQRRLSAARPPPTVRGLELRITSPARGGG